MTKHEQSWNPEQYRSEAGYVSELGKPVVDLLAPKRGERILDLGCGEGALALEIRARGADVLGIDASEAMVAAARRAGIEAVVGNAAALPFAGEFDAVFSNAVLHWIRPPEAVVAAVHRALRPGGRFVGEFGASGNVGRIVRAVEHALGRRGLEVPHVWFFPTEAEYRSMLEAGGFSVRSIEAFERPTRIHGDVASWLGIFAHHFLLAVPQPERAELLDELVEDLRDPLTDRDGNWYADYVRLRFAADKPIDAPCGATGAGPR